MSKILVFGHQNPDTDSISAAIAMAEYLKAKAQGAKAEVEVDVESVALGAPNEETTFALNHFGFEAPRVVETTEGASSVYLVDHNEFQQSIADIKDVNIMGVVDHHRIANFETANPLFYRAEPVGCTCTIIAKLFKEAELEIPGKVAGMMASAIISDTLLFKSPTCTPEDEKFGRELAAIAGIDVEAYGLELLKAGTNLASKSESELINMDVKSFPMGASTIRIAQVNTVSIPEVLERKAALEDAMTSENAANGFDQFVLVITDILESNSEILVVGGDMSKVEAAFNTKLVDNTATLAGVVSRKKQVVPQLTAAYTK
jgi:manganese-dependent inorganic pyrophosphatase